jgi:hypothetical protein
MSSRKRLEYSHSFFVPLAFVLAFALIPNSHLVTQPLEEPKGPQTENADWYIYQVERGKTNSVDVDSSLLPVIAYHGYGERGLRLASWSGGSWLIDKVDDEESAGASPTLVLDDVDDPVIAYWNFWPHPDAGALKIARWEDVNWTFEVVDNHTGGFTSMVLDSNGLPRLAYMDALNPGDYPQLWFASKNLNGTWTYEPVDTNDSLRYPSLAIDTRDLYHISYEELGTELRYAHWNGTNWTIEIVDTEGVVGAWSSIKADKSGRPHIAYYDGTHGRVKYATKSYNSWNKTSIDYSKGMSISLDLDSQDRPHISYHSPEHNLKHAYWNGSAWNIEVVDNTTGVGRLSSMKIDDHDDIHISYFDYSDPKIGHVKYASTKELPTGEIATSIDIDPDTLNLKSKGRWITAYLTTESAKAEDVDPASLLLNDVVAPAWWDIQNDTTLMVKFDRAEVQAIVQVAESVDLKVTGEWKDGESFEVHDTIRVIDPGR